MFANFNNHIALFFQPKYSRCIYCVRSTVVSACLITSLAMANPSLYIHIFTHPFLKIPCTILISFP